MEKVHELLIVLYSKPRYLDISGLSAVVEVVFVGIGTASLLVVKVVEYDVILKEQEPLAPSRRPDAKHRDQCTLQLALHHHRPQLNWFTVEHTIITIRSPCQHHLLLHTFWPGRG